MSYANVPGLLALIGQVPTPAAAAAATPAVPQPFSIIEVVTSAGPVVTFVMLLLGLFSVTSWAIIFLKGMMLRKAQKEGEIFLKLFWESRQLEEIYRGARDLTLTPLAEIYKAGYRELERFRHGHRGDDAVTMGGGETKGPVVKREAARDNVVRALRRTMTSEMTRLERATPFLATCGSSSPFIGLFGTVWGIMISFHEIGAQGSASLDVVAPGISEALVATAIGLFAAIPAVIAYNHFSNKIRILESEMEAFSADFLNIVERHIL
ncbi:MAG: protein TolQ [Deltaproteobacteria bacterium]|nr:protein TolQ [bacterium]MCB9476396.1 protein TolQ [Deltaproteobacteria bacterium]MCB9478371.1 protein TolQ [Deltaproteobacteria bacterium]MCB9489355.1 protein TolQ [Deltaproteobacteria bacterium]